LNRIGERYNNLELYKYGYLQKQLIKSVRGGGVGCQSTKSSQHLHLRNNLFNTKSGHSGVHSSQESKAKHRGGTAAKIKIVD
jgi:hypothetical protein